MANISGKNHANMITGNGVENCERYVFPKFHELWSTSAEKWNRHIYPPSINAACCFFACFAKGRHRAELKSTKLCDMLEVSQIGKSTSKLEGFPPPKLGAKMLIFVRFTTRNYTVSQKNCATLFLSELCQISTNFDNFWQKDGKEAKIMQGVLNLTKPKPCFICLIQYPTRR